MNTIDRIISKLEEKGLSPAKMMKDLGFSSGLFSQWKSGKQNPSTDKLIRISEYLNVPLAFLLNETIKINRNYHEDNVPENCCPICGSNYVQLEDSSLIDFSNSSKSSGYALKFSCDAEHEFYIISENYKGNNFITYTDSKFNPIKPLALKSEESEIRSKMMKLDYYGRKAVNDLLDNEYKRCIEDSETEEPTIEIMYSLLPASAGTGDFLEDENTELREFPDTPESRQADIVIPVDGDSMEPMFHDGDELYVRLQPAVEVGEIGIFIIDRKGYVKEYAEDRLKSLNPEYKDVYFDENQFIKCVGKVIGRVEV